MAKLSYTKKKNGRYARIQLKVGGKLELINIGYSTNKKQEARDSKLLELVSSLEVTKAAGLKLDFEQKKLLEILREKDPAFVERLVRKGLLVQTQTNVTVGQLFDLYKDNHLGVLKARTCRTYRQAQAVFEAFVGAETLISRISIGDVKDFISFCKKDRNEKGESKAISEDSTIGNYLKRTRSAFAYAVEKEWISENPIQYDASKFKIVKSNSKKKKQEQLLTEETLSHLLSQSHDFEFGLLLNLVRWTGCRIGEALILRWDDLSFSEDDPTITLREKDTEESGVNRDEMPTRVMPMWAELRPLLKKAKALAASDEIYVFNNILKLKEKPEFEIVDTTGAVLRRGRYETNANSRITKAIRRAGLTVWPQAWHGIRDYRINELTRLGFREAEITAWCGNSEATRKVHYNATAVTAADRRKAAGVRKEAAGVSMVYEKSAETELERIVQEMAESGKGRELLEIIQKALIQADSGELEIAEKYSGRNGFREDSQTRPTVRVLELKSR